MARKPLTPYQRARKTVKQALARGGNMSDDYPEHMPEDFSARWGLTPEEGQKLYDLCHPPRKEA